MTEKPSKMAKHDHPPAPAPGHAAASGPSDVDSVATDVASNQIQQPREVQEYVIKFVFRPHDDTTDFSVARTHYKILKTIKSVYPQTRVFDNMGQELKKFDNIVSYSDYLRHFKMQFVRPNPQKHRSKMYLVFHRILSTVPLGEIRRYSTISELLQRVNTRMSMHHWAEDDTKITTLGFFIRTDPINCIRHEFESRVVDQIVAQAHVTKQAIPRFVCTYSSPFTFMKDGTRLTTKAYDLQVRQDDAKQMISLLKSAFSSTPNFIFHKTWHVNLPVYVQAIQTQNKFLADSRIVPIQGVPSEAMVSLRATLSKLTGVQDILHHKLTSTKGRWSVVTTRAHFRQLAEQVGPIVQESMAQYANNHDLPDSFPAAGTAFRTSPYEDSSDGSFLTYISHVSSVLMATDTDEFNLPPASTAPVPQAWGETQPIPTNVFTSGSSENISSPGPSAVDRLRIDNARLQSANDCYEL